MMKKMVCIMVVFVVVFTSFTFGAEIIDTNEMTEAELYYRNGRHIVERCIGICLNNSGDGMLFNGDDYYNYINYSGVEYVTAGDIIITYLFYNPDTNYKDDIIQRSDWIIGNIYYYDYLEHGYFPQNF